MLRIANAHTHACRIANSAGRVQSIFVQLLFMALIVYLPVRMFKPIPGKYLKNKKTPTQKEYAE
jgi:hypothetical protein